MWIPETADELEDAVRSGDLAETPTLDFKEKLPPKAKNLDLAIDVDAMTPDGGVLIYGVGEDEHKRPSVLRPFKLAGARERVDLISQSSISEPPVIDVRALECSDDPSRGYLVVVVPQSARAPHQVTVRGEMRYFGRGATGNRRLTEGEVARLYARREKWELEGEELLDREFEHWRDQMPTSELGFLYAFSRPVVAESDLLEQAAAGTDEAKVRGVLADLRAAGNEAGLPVDPGLVRSPLTWYRRGAEGWELRREEPPRPGHVVRIDVDRNGHCHLFCDRAAEVFKDGFGSERRMIFETVLVGSLASLFALAGELYRRAGYVGAVDIGVGVGNLAGGLSETLIGLPLGWNPPFFTRNDFRNTHRVTALELVERPRELALELTRHLTEATAGPDYDPWV